MKRSSLPLDAAAVSAALRSAAATGVPEQPAGPPTLRRAGATLVTETRRRATPVGSPRGEAVLDFRILGPLEVRHDGRAGELGGPRNRALLAALLLRAGEPVSGDALTDAVWGEEAAPTASRALQVQVSRLRSALGPAAERLETVGGGYRLRVEPGELDADRFELACRRGAELPPREAAAVLREALAMWSGPVLADQCYHPWAHAEIRRLEELRALALEDRVG